MDDGTLDDINGAINVFSEFFDAGDCWISLLFDAIPKMRYIFFGLLHLAEAIIEKT